MTTKTNKTKPTNQSVEEMFRNWYTECGLDPENDETAAQHYQNGLRMLSQAKQQGYKEGREEMVEEIRGMIDHSIHGGVRRLGWEKELIRFNTRNKTINEVLDQLTANDKI